ncbi:MAG: HK97-gp10 family putative phage morphogenesis protein [Planctomycetaceae bacterium]
MDIRYQIFGTNQVSKLLQGLEKKVAKKCLRQAMRPAMKVVLEQAKKNAPVDTGAVKRNIKIRAAKRSTRYIGINVQIGSEGDYKGKQFYGSFLEYGTRYIKPRAFLKNAYTSTKNEARAEAMRRLRDLTLWAARGNNA